MDESTSVKRVKIRFPEISSKSWEHPADRAALTALRRVPGLDLLLQKLVGATTERSLRLITLASSVRVGVNQFPRIHRLHLEACNILDVASPPELYVTQTPFLNARAVGVDRPFIVLNSSMVESMSDEELLSVIGHELGHCLSGHVLYKTVLAMLLRFTTLAFSIPLGGASLLAVIIALREWDRKSELSADRAALLVAQDPNVCYQLEMKLAGGSNIGEMDINEFFVQAAEYQGSGNVLDSVYKLLNLMGQTHPFPVLRLAELKGWVDSGAYQKILNGEYIRRAQEADDDVLKNFRDAANKYREDFSSNRDPLSDSLRTAAEAAESVKNRAREAFEAIFGKDKE